MASIGHVAVGLLVGRAYEARSTREQVVAMGVMGTLAIFPDLDYIGVTLGLDYHGHYGHRGYSHSLLFALTLTGLAYLVARKWGTRPGFTALLAFLAVISHGVLDAMTYRTRGVPLLWPLTDYRFTLPWRPIPPAPVGASYISQRGLEVALVEMVYFFPLTVAAFSPRLATLKRWLTRQPAPTVALALPAGAGPIPLPAPFVPPPSVRVGAMVVLVTASMALAQYYLHDSRLVAWIERSTSHRELAVSLKQSPQYRHLH